MWLVFLQSIIVYLGLAITMYYLGRLYNTSAKYIYIVLAVLIYATIFGLRYGVGGDFFSYEEIFNQYISGKYYTDRVFEEGFIASLKVLSLFQSTSLIFCVYAFLPLFSITYGFNNIRCVYPFVFFSFIMLGTWLGYSNTIRQSIAIGFFVLSIKYALDKKLLFHYLIIALAISFHHSALVLLPFYFILNIGGTWFRNIRIQLILFAMSLIMMNISFIQELLSASNSLVTYLGYDNYLDKAEQIEDQRLIGVGFMLRQLLVLLLIINSEKVKAYFSSKFYNRLYDLTFIGILLDNAFVNSLVFSRVACYFDAYLFVIVGFTLYYLSITNKKAISGFYTLIVVVILSFVAVLYRGDTNWSLFVFNWQDQFYYVHRMHTLPFK